ncbi:hypothetical protein LCGC14_0784380 [marine sediment metagenome]|uniref:Uncharacterized protein n=1 Tax=marine sediment metagenome TaxID=412755 RepID=A0A0F9PYR6_9ZZZZ|nr:hypothetical protein [Phycisphaerae bacterium]
MNRRIRLSAQLEAIVLLVDHVARQSWCVCGFADATEKAEFGKPWTHVGPTACTCTWSEVDQVLNDIAFLHACVPMPMYPRHRTQGQSEAAVRIANVIAELGELQ